MVKIKITIMVGILLLVGGCGFVSLMGTPGRHERKTPAEFDLAAIAAKRSKKILVIVEQPAWVRSKANLRFYLTKSFNKRLEKTIGFKPENIVPYQELVNLRSTRPDYHNMTTGEIARALSADMVLKVVVADYNMTKEAGSKYYKGDLNTTVSLTAAGSGLLLWPKKSKQKIIRVGFEIESGGYETAVTRLATGSAFCTLRLLYDCPGDKYDSSDDRTKIDWQNWNE